MAEPHVHLWNTEAEEWVTYTPPADYDNPWIIRDCCEGRCRALLIRSTTEREPTVYVPEEAHG